MNLASNNHFSLNSPDSFQHKRGPSGWQWSTVAAACLALLTLATPGETIAQPATLPTEPIRPNRPAVALLGAVLVLACDIIGRLIRYPFEIPVATVFGVLGTVLFLVLLMKRSGHAV